MKTKLIALLVLPWVLACNQASEPKKERELNKENKLVNEKKKSQVSADSLKQTIVVPTLDSKITDGKNAIYSAAFMFAWNETEKKMGGNVIIKQDNSADFKAMVHNNTYKNVLLPTEYATKVSVDGVSGEIVAIAEFTKKLPFSDWFHDIGSIRFNGKGSFESFGIISHYDEVGISQMKIRHYNNNDEFIISLQPKDDDHEILLIMDTKYGSTLKDIFTSAKAKIKATERLVKSKKTASWKTYFTKLDRMAIPAIEFFIKNRYHDIEGQDFKAGNTPHIIVEAWQSIDFKFDRKGATLEDQGYMASDSTVLETEKPQPKFMVFNRPFAIFLKRKDAKYPYFGMMVNNSELLVPFNK
ncbi:MAG: hypothetical protein M0D57_00825 [Sphingobacteriales bacterium JAD_PAG50586_3]|nr:MAG: hypothetical protein M0D57_00825 [Sphingobacteriales bacterium JAD_PAG50586_3]